MTRHGTRASTAAPAADVQASGDTTPLHAELERERVSRWIAEGLDQGVNPEQALAVIGLGLMRRMAADPAGTWMWSEEPDQGPADLNQLRQRLELTKLAIETGAPLSTAEVTQLMGARPGAPVVERGGLRARRLSRNVWKLSRGSEEGAGMGGFQESLRRRL